MPRTILIHLNASVPSDDPRSADEIADAVLAALEVGLDGEPSGSLASGTDNPEHGVTLALVDEV